MRDFFQIIFDTISGLFPKPINARGVLERSKFELGDSVRIVATRETEQLNLAGKIGSVYGVTQPSSSGVSEVIGDLNKDIAVNVFFDDFDEQFWLSEELLEFEGRREISITLECAPGKKFVRDSDGVWREESVDC